VTLLAEVVACLQYGGSPFAMIGATAMAVLGASRSTQDLDLLSTDRAVLKAAFWSSLKARDATVEIRWGDIQDPLAGVVRVTREGDRPVDVIVGEGPWQERILADASPRSVADVDVPVVDEVGLVLLKLYAGGPQDRWDIEQLLTQAADREELERGVEERVSGLPRRCGNLWRRMTQSPDDPGNE
jgi:hypothetical protein